MAREFNWQKKMSGSKSGARVAVISRNGSKVLDVSIYEDQMKRMGWKKGDLVAFGFYSEESAVVIGLEKTKDEKKGYKINSSGKGDSGSGQISPTSPFFPMEIETVMELQPESCEKEDEQLVLVLKTGS